MHRLLRHGRVAARHTARKISTWRRPRQKSSRQPDRVRSTAAHVCVFDKGISCYYLILCRLSHQVGCSCVQKMWRKKKRMKKNTHDREMNDEQPVEMAHIFLFVIIFHVRLLHRLCCTAHTADRQSPEAYDESPKLMKISVHRAHIIKSVVGAGLHGDVHEIRCEFILVHKIADRNFQYNADVECVLLYFFFVYAFFRCCVYIDFALCTLLSATASIWFIWRQLVVACTHTHTIHLTILTTYNLDGNTDAGSGKSTAYFCI